MKRCCQRCGVGINVAVGNRVKVVGKEDGMIWVLRHVRQLTSLFLHGFIRPEIEGYVELCDDCFSRMKHWLRIEQSWEGAETVAISRDKSVVQTTPAREY